MARVHILSLLLFWRDEKISAFWIDLYERVKQDHKKITSLNSVLNQKLLKIDGEGNTDGWIEKIKNPVGDFITSLQNYSGLKASDTKVVFHLLRAFRNLASHKFGYENITKENIEKLNEIKKDVNEAFVDGRVKYWLENFPEFSIITFSAGLGASLSTNAILSEFKSTYFPEVNMNNLPNSCKPQFILVPHSLSQYSETLVKWIKEETKNKITALWKYSFTTESDNMKVTFLHIPKNAVIGLENRELLTLDWSPDQIKKTNVLQITRSITSLQEETACLLNKTQDTTTSKPNQNTSKSIRLNFTTSITNRSFPVIAFTDVIPIALQKCFKINPKGKKCVIFTNQPIDDIKRVVKQFCDSRSIKYSDSPILWTNLSTEYRNELKNESFLLHENSNIKLSIADLCSLNGFFNIDDMLPEILHEKSRVLPTFIERQKSLMPRIVSLNSGEHFHEKYLTSKLLQFNTPKSKNFYLINGAAYIGKSTLLATLGDSLVCKSEQLVLFTTCSKILSQLETSPRNFVKILYPHNKFQQGVGHYILKSQKYPINILVDNFHQLCKPERTRFFTDFLIPFIIEYKDLVINIFLSSRTSLIFEDGISRNEVEKHFGGRVNYLELKGLGNNTRMTYMKSLFQMVIRLEDADLVTALVEEYTKFVDKEFGQLADTPFACQIFIEIYKDLELTSGGFLDTATLMGPHIYEKFHNILLREEVAKTFQNHDIPKEFHVNSTTVDMGSSVFQSFKKAMEKLYGYQSLKLRFPNSEFERQVVFDPVLDMVRLSETFFPDYYYALLMFNKKRFLTEDVFDFEDTNTNNLKYYHILNFLDALLKGQKTKLSFKNNLAVKDEHHVMFVLIRQKLYYVFFAVVENFPEKVKGNKDIWSSKMSEIEKFLNVIMSKAIMSKSLNAIKFLVEIVGFDWKKFDVDKLKNLMEDLNSVDDVILLKILQNYLQNATS